MRWRGNRFQWEEGLEGLEHLTHNTLFGMLAVGAVLEGRGANQNQNKAVGGGGDEEVIHPPVVCPLLYSPVCAEDHSGAKNTFDNDCLLTASTRRRQDGLRKLHDGAC
ncbi:Protein of unknown function [Gryllus bimaculatus]|nr:Protein of unknown function [Gryllus bimaculatus]